jgi:asparagine synthase (glutamine-hydrolysing)
MHPLGTPLHLVRDIVDRLRLGALAGRVLTVDLRRIRRVRSENLTYLTPKKAASLVANCRDVEAAGLPGIFVEAGCALGGSTILMATAKASGRRFDVHDVFERIPSPTDEDTPDAHERFRTIAGGQSAGIGGDTYYGYRENLYEVVTANLNRHGILLDRDCVRLVRGLVEDTLVSDEPVAIAHVDVDWYQPVMISLRRIVPRLVAGGSVIIDDYHDWGGCRKATDEFLGECHEHLTVHDAAGSLKITRR